MNTKLTLISAVAGCALFAGGPAIAQTDLLDGWSGSASLGALFTSGNTDSTNVNGSASVSKQIDVWNHTAFGSTYTAESNDEETANRFDLGYKIDRQFNDSMYGFGRLRYDSDDYGNIDGRFTGVVGVGKKLLDDGKMSLSGEMGIGAHKTEFIEDPGTVTVGTGEFDPLTGFEILNVNTDNVEGTDADGAVLYLGLNYSNILSDTLTFNSVLNIEAADINTLAVWDNSLNVLLSDRISLSLGLLTRTNSDLGDDYEATDTATRINIVYGI